MHIYVVSAYMENSVCISAGDPNCGKIILCVFTCHMRADLHFLRVFSGDTIGSPSCSLLSMHIYVILAYMDSSVCISAGDPNRGEIILCAFTCHMRADFHKLRVSSGDTIGLAFGAGSFRVSEIVYAFPWGIPTLAKSFYAILRLIRELIFINCGFLVGIL